MDEQYTPERMDAMELVGKAHMLLNAENYDAARALLERAIAADPMYIVAYTEMGALEMLSDKPEEALKSYENALLIDKKNGEIHFHIGNAHLLSDRFSDAIVEYAKAGELGYETKELAENKAFCYTRLEEYAAAMSAYNRAVSFNPDDPVPRIAMIHLMLAQENYEGAEKSLEDFILRFPQAAEGYEMMVDALVGQGKTESAEAFINITVEKFPDAYPLWIQKARVTTLLERYDEALSVILKAREYGAEQEAENEINEYEANIHIMKGDVDGALALYERILANEGEETDVSTRVAYMNLLNSAGRYDALLRVAQSSLKKPEADAELCMAYALEPFALENLGRTDEAFPLYRQAITKLRRIVLNDSARVDSYMYRALCHRGLKEYDKALEQMTIFEEMGIENEYICRFRASIYNAMGDTAREKKETEKMERLRAKPDRKGGDEA